MLAEKRKEIGEAAERLRNGLAKIIETGSKVEEMKTDLEVSQHRGKAFKTEMLILIQGFHRSAADQC